MGWKTEFKKDAAEKMDAFHMWCFICAGKVFDKSEAKLRHRGHDVTWVRDSDGVRYEDI